MNTIVGKYNIGKILILLLLASGLSAQTPSPYAIYGLGYLRGDVFSSNRQMGSISAAYHNPLSINQVNPASLADIGLTTFEVGGDADHLEISSNDSSYVGDFGSLSHLAIAFPVKFGRWGAAISFKPYSSVRYNFTRDVNDVQIGEFSEIYTGRGHLYTVMLSNGVKYKGFSLGLGIGLLFGHVDYSKIIYFSPTVGALSSRNVAENTYRGFVYNLGAQYRQKITGSERASKKKDPIYVTLGAYGSSSIGIRVKSINYWQRFDIRTNGELVRDTIGSLLQQKSNTTLPGYFGAGLSFDLPGRWLIGLDFKYNLYSQFTSSTNKDAFANNYRIAVGTEYTPDRYSKNFLKQMIYRIGGFGGNSELVTESGQLDEWGVSAGFGFPVRKAGSLLNLGFEFKNRGTISDSQFNERYYTFSLGLIINDRWFVKRKFD